MKFNGIRCTLACLGIAALAAPAAFAQQLPSTSDQYQGVSQPPPDDTIVATPDTPPPAVTPKPSPRVYAPPPPPSSVSRTPAMPRTRSVSDAPVVTTGPNPPARWDNTDYGIITTPVPVGEDDPVPPDTAILHVRDSSRTSGPSNALAVGTQIQVRIAQALSTDTTLTGAAFRGKVMLNVVQGGSIIIPAGSTLRGRVAQVDQGHRFGGTAVLRLRPETIILPDGTAYRLDAEATSSEAAGVRIGSEGAILPSSHLLKQTAEYGLGVGTGAAVGAGLAGPAGALVGSVAGAGVVTTHILVQPPHAVNVPAGAAITFSLTQPLDLTPARS